VEEKIIPEINVRIKKGESFIENLTKTLNKIDTELENFDISSANNEILIHNTTIRDYNEKLNKLNLSISQLKDFYDENKYNELINERDDNKQKIYEINLKIKEVNNQILMKQHEISVVNGEIFRLNQNIEERKKETETLKNSKICPTCKQKLNEEHILLHIEEKIKTILDSIENINGEINIKRQDVIPKYEKDIVEYGKTIKKSFFIQIIKKKFNFISFFKNITTDLWVIYWAF
jgi:predicted  nucleic acid-binding Zn-ribbon protein